MWHMCPLEESLAESVDVPLAEFMSGSFDFRNAWERRIVLGEYVARILEVLTSAERIMLELRYVEGCAIEALAQEMGMPDGTFKSRVHRAREKALAQMARIDERPLD